jgi:hypothetical protein
MRDSMVRLSLPEPSRKQEAELLLLGAVFLAEISLLWATLFARVYPATECIWLSSIGSRGSEYLRA